MLKQTVNKNNIHVPVGVSQVSQLVVMILLIDDCYVMSLLVTTSRMNFVLYRNNNDIILLLPWHIVISGFYYIFYTFTLKILKNRRASNKFIFSEQKLSSVLTGNNKSLQWKRAMNLVRVVSVTDIRVAYCKFESKQANSKTLFGRRPNNDEKSWSKAH